MSPDERRTQDWKTEAKQSNTERSPFDDLAMEYDAWFDSEGSLIFLSETRAFKSLLSFLPRPWLEIGVGSGRFAHSLGIETGVDPAFKLLQIARRRGINAILGRGEQQLFDEESFGTVFLIVTLCFLDSPLSVLTEIHRILISGGKVVLGLVLRESPWGEFYQQKNAEGHRFYRYATFYSYDEAVRLLVEAGFTTERIVSTLFQRPDEVRHVEESKEGYFPNAGFTIIIGVKHENNI
jgi:SAM-dependent methyltransferase